MQNADQVTSLKPASCREMSILCNMQPSFLHDHFDVFGNGTFFHVVMLDQRFVFSRICGILHSAQCKIPVFDLEFAGKYSGILRLVRAGSTMPFRKERR